MNAIKGFRAVATRYEKRAYVSRQCAGGRDPAATAGRPLGRGWVQRACRAEEPAESHGVAARLDASGAVSLIQNGL
ncbi:hypothetical protein GCM10018779_32000 [Streptomyces griseocarneus]|nr:hypothetical protein GCM10018779_32000 [Streptomyces griseocarneus]